MKKQLYILFVLLFSAVYALGQSVVGYEYWFDNDFAQRVNQPISPSDPLTVSTQVGTQNLAPGFHSLSFRAMDDSGYYSPISTTHFYKITPTNSTPSSTLTAFEYWWNNDYAQRQTLPANNHSVIQLDTLLSASNLHRGFNVLNVRFKDGDGLWSSISTHYFLIPNFDSGSNPQSVTQLEYWWNNDYANRTSIPNTPTPAIQLDSVLAAAQLSRGFNSLNVRYRDTNGMWSSVSTSYFLRIEPATPSLPQNVVEYEYWFNTDFQQRVSQTSAGSVVQLNMPISTANLSPGFNTINIRYKQSSGIWSSVVSSYFVLPPSPAVWNGNTISKYRYWFDQNVQQAHTVLLPNPVSNTAIQSAISMVSIPKGVRVLHVQFGDAAGHWSSVSVDSIIKNPLPIGDFNYSASSNCDSLQVSFTSTSIDADTYLWNFGDGSTSTALHPTHAYSAPGSYVVQLTVSDTTALLDSTIQKTVQVFGNTFSSFSVSQCESYTAPSGTVFTTSGVYQDTIANFNGCDSIMTIVVSILQPAQFTDVQSSCGPYTWIDGNTYTSSTNSATYTYTGGAANGCDSIITLDLTINNAVASTQTISACGSFLWIDGNTYSSNNNSATYTFVGGAANGCDSTVTLDLTILSPASSTQTVSACGSYVWIDGSTYTSSNNSATYTYVGGAANGCDSTVTLDLTILNPASSTQTVSACDSYVWIDGNTYTSNNNSATYTYVGGAANGCDSTVTLDLTILNPASSTQTVSACDSYVWIDGNTYTSSNNSATYTYFGGAANGCDSTVTLDLTILNPASSTQTVSACDSYIWIDGNTYTSSNNSATYTYFGGAANGCDSIVSLDLTINTVETGVTQTNTTLTANASGAQYQWLDCSNNFAVIPSENGQSFTAVNNGFYAVEVTENGCTDTSACYEITGIGLHESKLDITVYPNPTDRIVYIRSRSNFPIEKVEVRNSLGQIVSCKVEYSSQVRVDLDVVDGIYYILIHSEGLVYIKKLSVLRTR